MRNILRHGFRSVFTLRGISLQRKVQGRFAFALAALFAIGLIAYLRDMKLL